MSVSARLVRSFLASFSSLTLTNCGLNSLACFSIRERFLPQESATTCISPCSLTTSSVCVPIEPVEPSIDIFFMIIPRSIFFSVVLNSYLSFLFSMVLKSYFLT